MLGIVTGVHGMMGWDEWEILSTGMEAFDLQFA
jgi:hypothetical protein